MGHDIIVCNNEHNNHITIQRIHSLFQSNKSSFNLIGWLDSEWEVGGGYYDTEGFTNGIQTRAGSTKRGSFWDGAKGWI